MAKPLDQIQWEIRKWHRDNFPTLKDAERPNRIAGKFIEETTEFLCSLGLIPADQCTGRDDNPAEEAADIIITLLGWATFSGIDLAQTLENRLEVIKQRKFELRNGRYYRIGKDYPDALDRD